MTHQLYFESSELLAAPHSYEIYIDFAYDPAGIRLDYQLYYTQREDLEIDEIQEEGYSENDDLRWQGNMNLEWAIAFREMEGLFTQDSPSKTPDGKAKITHEKKTRYTSETDAVIRFLEQLQQAIFEELKMEAPMELTILRIKQNQKDTLQLEASFMQRNFTQNHNGQRSIRPWADLDNVLKTIFAGDLYYEKASTKPPKKDGYYLNLGDEWWFEQGKSVIYPQKNALATFFN